MTFTREQAIEAIRQHPEVASIMALSKREQEILSFGRTITTDDLKKKFTISNASRFMRRLIEKGYVKRVGYGVFERL